MSDLLLGIETSCDETAFALFDGQKGLIGHTVYAQIALHAPYGGVVPELASRDHARKCLPSLQSLLASSGCDTSNLSAIAYTAGPGLIGALLVGATFGEALAFGLGIPAIPVHHMEAHLLAPFLETPSPTFPFLALLISGGHTQLYAVTDFGSYTLLGDTVDDAVGEAFDKTAKLLGLGYPGGPKIEQLATQGDPNRFDFPRPLTKKPGLDFSFSGLKTHTRQTLEQTAGSAQDKADIACAFQQAVIDTLKIKCTRAIKQTGLKRLVVAGGVSANQTLRTGFATLAADLEVEIFYPRSEFCTDNAAMVAFCGYQQYRMNRFKHTREIKVYPRWPLGHRSSP